MLSNVFPSAFILLAILLPGLTCAQTAVWSDAFVDSVGINVHLHFDKTLYAQFPLVKTALVHLGVRHLRDGLIDTTWTPYYDELNYLGGLGIHTTFVSSVGQSATLLQTYPTRVGAAFEGYEGPNEYDISGVSDWPQRLTGQLVLLAANAPQMLGKMQPILGPSLTQPSSYALLGPQAKYFTYANMHNYYGSRNPGTAGWGAPDTFGNAYGGVAFNLAQVSLVAPGAPVVTTETGYNNDTTVADHLDEATAAIYLPRLLLEQWNAGVKRTYLYELMSENGEDYGLLRSDGNYKPAYYAVAYMLNLLKDQGTSFTAGSLSYNLAGADNTVHKLLLQKRDGTYYLAVWREVSSFDPVRMTQTPVPSIPVTLQTSVQVGDVVSYQWDATGNVTPSNIGSGTAIPLSISDKLQIIRLSPGTQANSVNVTLNSNVPNGWISVDGSPIAVGTQLQWHPGDLHSLSGWSPQAKNGIVYLFQQWTSGTTGSTDQVVAAPMSNTAYTGSYLPANALNAYGSGGGSVTLSNPGQSWGGLPYFLSTDIVKVTANPNKGCRFTGWTGSTNATTPSISIVMSTYQNVIALFQC